MRNNFEKKLKAAQIVAAAKLLQQRDREMIPARIGFN